MNFDKIRSKFPNGELRTRHPFYMADALADIPGCLEACLDLARVDSMQAALQKVRPQRIVTVGCGTSYNACQGVAYACRTLLKIPAEACDPLDFELDSPAGLGPSTLVISISHSGQTLITCHAQEKAKSLGAFTVGISGNPASRLAKSAGLAVSDPYVIEIPFGKTRSYLSSTMMGMLAAVMTAPQRTRDEFIINARGMIPLIRENRNGWENSGRSIAAEWAGMTSHYLLTGFGVQKPNADEIGLKLVEVLGESAAGYSLEGFTHGPFASFRKDMGIFLFQTDERSLEKALLVAKGIAISEARLVVITDQPEAGWPEKAKVIRTPRLEGSQQLAFFPAAIAAQHLVYFLALQKGMNPDINGYEFYPELRGIADIYFPPGTH